MAMIKKFEDLVCWQRCRELSNFVFDFTDRKEFRDFDLKRQIRRAAVSPMSNIAEGFDRATRGEFVDALFIAKGEVGEVRAQMYISHDRRYIDISTYQKGLSLTDECSRLIQSFAMNVKGESAPGLQFKHIQKRDPNIEMLKQNAPEVYKKYYNGDGSLK